MNARRTVPAAFVAATGVALVLRRVRPLAWITVVDGTSMEPTLRTGERLLVLSAALRPPRRGDVVVVRSPVQQGRHLVKRVTGLPGDVGTGPAEMGDAETDGTLHARAGAPCPVPVGHVYVLGDSPGLDSSVFGPVPEHLVIGTVVRPRCIPPPSMTGRNT